MKNIVVFMLLLVVTGGCATSYHPYTHSTGYEEVRLSDTTFGITYVAALSTSFEQIKAYALRRAAEITLENGYTHFVVTKQEQKDIRPSCDCKQVKAFVRRAVIIEVRCSSHGGPGAFDARAYLEGLRRSNI